jgi:hypothetical protein
MSMQTTVKAIETRYKGYRFRSRLEARWAVFFDTCGIEWKYEPEGYDLSKYGPSLNCQHGIDIGCYLPDFFLPKTSTWLEIKPCLPEIHFGCTLEEDKLCALALHTGQTAVMFFGPPDDDTPASVAWPNECEYNEGCSDWAKVSRHQYFYIFQIADFPICLDGIKAAKSARFEFGERGAG